MYPQIRMRRLRQNILQPMFKETRLVKDELIMPLFFDEKAVKPVPIASMPGQFRHPLSCAEEVAEEMKAAGLRVVLLFGIPKCKDTEASGAFAENGIVQEATRRIKAAVPDLIVITDTCACEYTSHGHCGILCGKELDNDTSLLLMEKIAVSQAVAGADMIAPSCMLDGQVTAIREALDEAGFSNTPIMSYSTKFASALYGPFREAADSGFSFGDRTSYQMSPANRRGGDPRILSRRDGGSRHPDGKTRRILSRCPPRCAGVDGSAARRLSGLGRVFDDQGCRDKRLDR